MDFKFENEDEKFREEVIDFIDKELPWDWRNLDLDAEDDDDKILVRQFKKKLGEKGWLTMAWPEEYGGQAASHMRQVVFNEEMAYRGIPVGDAGIRMVGPILMLYGTDEQKKQFLPQIAGAEINWSQGYSEPDSGSDLASLQTRAVEDGDDFVVSGSKIWNSAHADSDWMFMLVRTNPDAPKHRGISFVLTELEGTEGVTIEKIPMMWNAYRGLATFSDVRIPKKNLVGEQDRGWYVGAALLDFERSGVDRPAKAKKVLEDLVQFCKTHQKNGRLLSEDPIIRRELADLAVQIETTRLMCYNVAWMQSKDLIPNMEASITKAYGTEMINRLYGLGVKIMGIHGQLEPESKWAPLAGRIENAWLRSFGGMVAAGTSEIQRSVIATRGLGLPRG
ncbi:MAG: acyl-CoA dehydrogenase family protein [SAR202 cluster bacterium]|mgnify:FL=1|nr:acyl-CoA dehydrogenase family protein [SAR202 cluster bacterium]|tara:strand:- start:1211 stop:2386 length:1176 start_codon:yes stop_codon:yes gene_type:complete